MRPSLHRLVFAALLGASVLSANAADVALTIPTDKTVNTISPFIYGHFFEHIYNGGDNGLWGEMVWNRSFEYVGPDQGTWTVKDGVVSETAQVTGAKLLFGDEAWTDYDFTLEAKKTAGAEGFLIVTHATPERWNWSNIGGWGNAGHQLQHVGDPGNADIDRRVNGKIETDKWYKIKVHVEGRKVQTYIDDKLVLDNTLAEDLVQPGCVGIGTWNTAAQFKNMKVTDLKGKVLFEGLPKVTNPDGAGMHWDVAGGEVKLTSDGAFNDEHAVQIEGPTAEDKPTPVGISQDNFCLKKGETYKGSLFQKGTAAFAKVIFKSAGKTVVEVPLSAPTKDWAEAPIVFTSPVDAPDATMEISYAGHVHVTLDQVSLMSEASIKNDGFRPDIYAAFAALKPTIIRWPGGCYLEQYHWKNGIGPQSKRLKSITPMWDDYDPNCLGTDEYMTLSKKLGSEPLLVVNTGMHVTGTKNLAEWQPWIDEACEWIEYCNGPVTSKWGKVRADNGHPEPYKVKFWEIDNELWRSLQTSPAVYAQAVKAFAAAMKKQDPSITIIAHGGNDADERYDNTLIAQSAAQFDVLSIHHYQEPNRFESGIAVQDKLYADLIKTIKASGNPKIKLDISEWNAQSIDWRTGLYAAGLLNTFEKYGDNLMIGGPALLFRHTSATAWDNAFINFDHKGYFVAPNYVMMKLWRENFAPNRLAVEGTTGRLNIIATKTDVGDKVILKLVNPSDTAMDVTATLSGAFKAGTASMQLVAPSRLDAQNSMDKPDVVKPVASQAKVSDGKVTFHLPAISAGVVTIQSAP